MADVTGQLGAADVPGTGTLTSVYKVPALQKASVNLYITNRTATATIIRVAHIKNGNVGDIANEDYIQYDLDTTKLVHHTAMIPFTGIAMAAGDTLAVYSSATAVSANANGIEVTA